MKTQTIVILAAVGIGVYLMFFRKTSMADQQARANWKAKEAYEREHGKTPTRMTINPDGSIASKVYG